MNLRCPRLSCARAVPAGLASRVHMLGACPDETTTVDGGVARDAWPGIVDAAEDAGLLDMGAPGTAPDAASPTRTRAMHWVRDHPMFISGLTRDVALAAGDVFFLKYKTGRPFALQL